MKLGKWLLTLAVLCLLLPGMAMQTKAATDSGEAGDNVTWTLDSEGTLTISGMGAITGHPWANDYATVIKKVIIEEGITRIPNGAFIDCTSISEMRIPATMEELDYFSIGCSVGSLYISDLKQWLEMDKNSYTRFSKLYVNGEQITDLVIPEGITEIASEAFDEYTTLESVYIPDSVTSIGVMAFYGCENLKEVRLSNTMTAIPQYAFTGCKSLDKITIPANIQVIGAYAFGQHEWSSAESYGLEEIRFEGNAPLIADDAFWGVIATAYYSAANESWTADKLQNYNGGEDRRGTITWVADDNISDTGGTSEVYIIASGTCGGNLTWILYSNDHMDISAATTYALRSAGANDMDDYTSAEETPWYVYRDRIKSITVEEGVNSIGDNAFAGLENLTEVTIQDGVAEIGDSAFSNCQSLTEVTFEGSAPTFGENVFTEVEATVNYPAGDESWSQEVVEEVGGSIQLNPDENLHAHSYAEEITAPTCTEQGYTTYTCECGKTYVDNYADPVAHSYGAPAYTWAADNSSCTASFTCEACANVQTAECNVVSTPSDGSTVYIATVEFEGQNYFDTRTVETEAEPVTLGDANGDGRVNFKDAILVLQFASSRITADKLDIVAADVNGDGRHNFKDAILMLQIASGRA